MSVATVGALVASRRPRHPVGWLLLAFGLSLTAAGVTVAYSNYGVARADAPGAGLVALYVPATIVTAMACVGDDHRGHAGRLAAGRDPCTSAR